jgi:hypothetical protein
VAGVGYMGVGLDDHLKAKSQDFNETDQYLYNNKKAE